MRLGERSNRTHEGDLIHLKFEPQREMAREAAQIWKQTRVVHTQVVKLGKNQSLSARLHDELIEPCSKSLLLLQRNVLAILG